MGGRSSSSGLNNDSSRRWMEEYIGRTLTDGEYKFISQLVKEKDALPDTVTRTTRRQGIVDPTNSRYLGQEPGAEFLPPGEYERELARIKTLPGVDYTVETTQVRNAVSRRSETWGKITYTFKNPQKGRSQVLESLRETERNRRRR